MLAAVLDADGVSQEPRYNFALQNGLLYHSRDVFWHDAAIGQIRARWEKDLRVREAQTEEIDEDLRSSLRHSDALPGD